MTGIQNERFLSEYEMLVRIDHVILVDVSIGMLGVRHAGIEVSHGPWIVQNDGHGIDVYPTPSFADRDTGQDEAVRFRGVFGVSQPDEMQSIE